MSSLKYFKISKPFYRKTILTWDSASTVKHVACYVSTDGFHFSEIEEYNTSTKNMKGLASKILPSDKMEILNKEIEELKNIFRVYNNDVEIYFK